MNQVELEAGGYRIVGGELVSSSAVDTSKIRVEVLRRKSDGPITWRFRQPKLALFWFRSGVERLHLQLDGMPYHADVCAASNFALFPACLEIGGEFEVQPYCDYAAVFMDPGLISDPIRGRFERPLVAFGHRELQHSLPLLCREAASADTLFDLFAEGWAMQTLAQLARIAGTPQSVTQSRGGLPAASVHRVREYILANLASTVTLDELALIAGVSRRHFLRAFQESVGQTPLRYVQSLRIEKAKQLLSDLRHSITEIALDCGFCHAQHFSTSFKRTTGVTPSAFRHSYHS